MLVLILGLTILAASFRQQYAEHFGRPLQWRDWMLYRAIENRVSRGEDYYSAAASEHRLHRYPTTPPQVFREPTLTWLLVACRTEFLQRLLLVGLSVATLFALWLALRDNEVGVFERPIALALVAGGVVLDWTPISFYIHEIWSGLLVALSLALYRPDRWRIPILLGILACLIRELAFPYLLVMGACALYEKRWRELRGWLAAIASVAVFFVWHLLVASRLYAPGDLTFTTAGWFYFGGWPFVVESSKMNLILIRAPNAVVSLWACCGILGLTGVRNFWFSRAALVVGIYMLSFLFVGLPGNSYWGLLYAPLLPIGLVFAPQCLRDLVSRAMQPIGFGLPVKFR